MTPVNKTNPLLGQWRITEMPMFVIEDFEPPMLTIYDARRGLLEFCGIEASVDCEYSERDGRSFMEFTWLEPSRKPQCGRGWATLDGETITGKIYFHMGDSSPFEAKRIDVPAKKRQSKNPKSQTRIPDSIRKALQQRLEKHIVEKWSHTQASLQMRFRGRFAYIDTQVPTDQFPTHLCRLAYLGDAEQWEFAFYKYSDDVYEKSRDWNGSFVTTPEMAFDVAATVYLTDS